MSQTEAPAPAAPAIPPDPLVTKSYSVPIALAMLAVVAAAVLAVADEMYFRRPYKKIQGQYQEAYSDYLARVEWKRRGLVEGVILKSEDLAKLDQALIQATKDTASAIGEAQAALDTATNQGRAIVAATKDAKSEISALSYKAEDRAHAAGHAVVSDAPEASDLLADVKQIQDRDITYSWKVVKVESVDEAGRPEFTSSEETETAKVAALLAKALEIEVTKANLQQALSAASKPKNEAAKARDQWVADNLADLRHAVSNATEEEKKRIAALGAARYLDQEAVSLDPGAIAGMKESLDASIPHGSVSKILRGDIKQIHIAEAGNWVDRCETCHLNARSPMPVTLESLRQVLGTKGKVRKEATDGSMVDVEVDAWPADKLASTPLELFTSHPNPALLKTHDPERFGCSMCHNGNGVAITSTELAHGENHHWLQPLFPKEHVQAGCVQCHQQDLVLANGDRINAGKDTFRRSGCWGCHKYQGFNTEVDRITALEGRIRELDLGKKAKRLRYANLQELRGPIAEADESAFAKEAPKIQSEQDALTQEISALDTDHADVSRRLRQLYLERQRVGPNLKDVRVKIRPEFLTEWIRNPREAHKDETGRAFRPDTKMPVFRWWGDPDEEVKDVSAFIWQSGLDPAKYPEMKLPAVGAGDAKRGEDLLTKRGCLACHSIGTGEARHGAEYAANLSNLGEKDTPEYVARWISDPRRRLVAYDPARPLGRRDVAGAAADDMSVVWTQHAIMPNFRLSDADVRDITTFLTGQRRAGVKYDTPTWLDDTSRFERGRKLVVFQGCAGCHEIAGLEDEKGIGTELTFEGTKPRDQLDFGHHTIAAERGVEPLKDGKGLLQDTAKLFQEEKHWYRPLGFFLHKIAKPDLFDDSKHLPDRFGRLRMPQFDFSAQEVTDVATLVLGSAETKLPQSMRYNPGEAGKAIRDGWWVIKKYNCQGCHQVLPTDVPAVWKSPAYADKVDPKFRDTFLPPTLVGAGFRLKPDAIAKFLRDPSLGGGRAKPASVRAHLEVRMPTFDMSDEEIETLVRFFGAMSGQSLVYQPKELKPLSAAELKAASAIWKAANCMQCHVVDGMAPTTETKAPNLSYVPERLRPEWMQRWIADPPGMNPATAMLRLFGDAPKADGRWHYMQEDKVPELQGVPADHVDLMVRYILQGHAGK